jgi:hypothetical protein
MVAAIASVEPVLTNRFNISFREFARINITSAVWQGQRNPIHYTTLSNLGINVDDLIFEPATSNQLSPADLTPNPIRS